MNKGRSEALIKKKKQLQINSIKEPNYKIFMVQTSCEPFHSGNEIATIYENFGCAAGNTVATVYPDGTVSPCSLLGDGIELDSLRSKSFSTIWHAGKGFQKIRNLAIPYHCLSCDDYQTCSGGCRARAGASYGNIQSSIVQINSTTQKLRSATHTSPFLTVGST
ncbi:MAG: SPASM domain-containing protein [bacterium]|nr:SPASM domain-containing protein [bacterium]